MIPGGSFYLEHNNVNGKGQSLTASVSTSNILYPEVSNNHNYHFPLIVPPHSAFPSLSFEFVNFVNFLTQEDLGFKATWIVPFSRKVKDFFGRTFNLTALKLRGLSPALNPGPESMENFGSVWVDRLGFKALISEVYLLCFPHIFPPFLNLKFDVFSLGNGPKKYFFLWSNF